MKKGEINTTKISVAEGVVYVLHSLICTLYLFLYSLFIIATASTPNTPGSFKLFPGGDRVIIFFIVEICVLIVAYFLLWYLRSFIAIATVTILFLSATMALAVIYFIDTGYFPALLYLPIGISFVVFTATRVRRLYVINCRIAREI